MADLYGIPRPDLEGIAARAEQATEGPWRVPSTCQTRVEEVAGLAHIAECNRYDLHGAAHDAEFIAHARVDLPAVTAYALRLEAEVERLQQADVLLGDAVLRHIAKASDEDWRKFGERYEAYCLSCPSVPDDFEALRKIALGEEVPDVG